MVACVRCRVILYSHFTVMFSVMWCSLITYCCWQLRFQGKHNKWPKNTPKVSMARLMIKSPRWVWWSACSIRALHSVCYTLAPESCHLHSAFFVTVSNTKRESLIPKLPGVWLPLAKHEVYSLQASQEWHLPSGAQRGFGDEGFAHSVENRSLRRQFEISVNC